MSDQWQYPSQPPTTPANPPGDAAAPPPAASPGAPRGRKRHPARRARRIATGVSLAAVVSVAGLMGVGQLVSDAATTNRTVAPNAASGTVDGAGSAPTTTSPSSKGSKVQVVPTPSTTAPKARTHGSR